jgi:hypothetical protein
MVGGKVEAEAAEKNRADWSDDGRRDTRLAGGRIALIAWRPIRPPF